MFRFRSKCGKLLLETLQAGLAEVAVSSVVVTTLVVIEVGNDDTVEAVVGKDVKAGEPVRFDTDLVDLVDGGREGAQREGSSRGDAERAVLIEHVQQVLAEVEG